jgi:diadenosine tetraphosphate (Ap4A) HIT family hydrolase
LTRGKPGIWEEGPAGVFGGSIWDDPARWSALVDGSACPVCLRGRPLGVLVERAHTWITSGERVPVRGYLCVVAKRHVVEPYELPEAESAAFWQDVLLAAERVARLLRPIKINYELHGNSLPHLHAHVYPRFPGDRFVGGPIDGRRAPIEQSPAELGRLGDALAASA